MEETKVTVATGSFLMEPRRVCLSDTAGVETELERTDIVLHGTNPEVD